MHQDRGLIRHIAIPFALFAIIGSLLLVGWLGESARQDSRQEFLERAEANAAFVRRSRLPASPTLADNLSEIHKMTVVFRVNGNLVMPTKPRAELDQLNLAPLFEKGSVESLGQGKEAIELDIDDNVSGIFITAVPGFAANLGRWSTLVPLATFWLISFLLANTTSRKLVRPIQALATSVSDLGTEKGAHRKFPGTNRSDELGHLARALTSAQENLLLERQRREESEKLAILGKMATGLAHEIRNPVAAVRMHAQILRESGVEVETATMIESEAGTIESLVTQWMFLARPKPPEVRHQDLKRIVYRCVEVLGRAFKHARVRVVVDIPEALYCDLDEARLEQALRNILLNAVQAMPNGGDLNISGSISASQVLVTICDGGMGFSQEALERYGELFYSTKEGGMGVGSAVANEIIKAHSGTLVASNQESGGAMVTLTLPIAT